MKYAAKADDNQREIVRALRDAGATVVHLHTVGGGCPDICVGYRGANYLIEIKDGSKPPSAQKLTPAQLDWHRDWRGRAAVVNSVEAALKVIGVQT
jgi:Holliday junction resolvase